MTQHFLKEESSIQHSLVEMGKKAGEQMEHAVQALIDRDEEVAYAVFAADDELDRLEEEHEERIIELLARNQPLAKDLRLLVASLRINTTIERAGDIATNIAQSAQRLASLPQVEQKNVDIPQYFERARALWRDTMKALENLDADAAAEIWRRDDTIDDLNRETISRIIEFGNTHPDYFAQVTNLVGVSKSLERFADMAVTIADEIIYASRGRHHPDRHKPANQ